MTPIRKGILAVCSRGDLGLVTSDGPVEVDYGGGNKGVAWTGEHMHPTKRGEPWSSRNPRALADMEADEYCDMVFSLLEWKPATASQSGEGE